MYEDEVAQVQRNLENREPYRRESLLIAQNSVKKTIKGTKLEGILLSISVLKESLSWADDAVKVAEDTLKMASRGLQYLGEFIPPLRLMFLSGIALWEIYRALFQDKDKKLSAGKKAAMSIIAVIILSLAIANPGIATQILIGGAIMTLMNEGHEWKGKQNQLEENKLLLESKQEQLTSAQQYGDRNEIILLAEDSDLLFRKLQIAKVKALQTNFSFSFYAVNVLTTMMFLTPYWGLGIAISVIAAVCSAAAKYYTIKKEQKFEEMQIYRLVESASEKSLVSIGNTLGRQANFRQQTSAANDDASTEATPLLDSNTTVNNKTESSNKVRVSDIKLHLFFQPPQSANETFAKVDAQERALNSEDSQLRGASQSF